MSSLLLPLLLATALVSESVVTGISPRRSLASNPSVSFFKAVELQQQQEPITTEATTTTEEATAGGGDNNNNNNGDKIFSYPYESYKLESNGLPVVIFPLGDDFPGIVSVHLTVNVGSRNELEEGKTGMAHFFEHMMFGGTNNVSFEEFDATYLQLGATYNAFTSPDLTNYYATFPKTSSAGESNLEKIMYYESDRFKNLNYTEDKFKTEAGAILGEYNYYASSISSAMDEHQQNLSYSVHPYKHSTLGTIEDIRDMPNEIEYSRQFFERFYKPENCVLMIFGDVNVDQTKAVVEEYWADWEKGEVYVSDIPQEPLPHDSARYEHMDWPEAGTPWISLNFIAANFSVTELDYAALGIISGMVFSDTSDIYKKLVLDEQVAISLGASYFPAKDPALFSVYANVASIDSLWYVRDEILMTLAKLRKDTVSSYELDAFKSALKYGAAMGLDSTESIASNLQYYIGLTGDPESFNQIYALYNAVTPAAIHEVANKYFTDGRLATITLAFVDEPLLDPPAPVSAADNAFAGSVDSLVEAASDVTAYTVDQVVLPSDASELVDFDIRFRVGAADDPEGKEGLSYLTTSMVSDAGSASLTIEQINDLLLPMAAYFYGYTDKEYSYFGGTVHVDNLERYWDIVSEQILSPGFREEDFQRIKTETIRGIHDSVFDDDTVAARALDASIFEGHPFERPSSGTIPSIESITLDDVKSFYAERFTKQNVILGLGGGISDQFVEKVNFDLQQLPDGRIDKEFVEAPPLKSSSNAIVIEQQASESTIVTFGFSLPLELMTPGHPDYPALSVALNYLGSGKFSSKLMSEIRAKRGLNYGDIARLRYSGLAFQVDIGALDTTEIAHFATRLAVYELNHMITQGLTGDEFEASRNELYNGLPLVVATLYALLSSAIDGLEYGYGEDYLGYMQGKLSNVTLEEVNEVTKKWLQDESMTFVFVTPDAANMSARLANETISTVQYASDQQPEEVLQKDEIVKEYPLGLSPSNVEIVKATDLFPGTEAGLVEFETVVAEREGPNAIDELQSMKGDDVHHPMDHAEAGSGGSSSEGATGESASTASSATITVLAPYSLLSAAVAWYLLRFL